MNRLLFSTVALASMIAALPAHGATLDWTLSGVTFDDGGTASGIFSVDTVTGNVLSFDITTTAGSTLTGFTYNSSTSYVYLNNFFSANSFIIVDNFLSRYANFRFANSLTSGGTNSLVPGGPITGSWECSNCTPVRAITGGFATATSAAVPEPSAWALFILGFGAVGAALRQRKVRIAFA